MDFIEYFYWGRCLFGGREVLGFCKRMTLSPIYSTRSLSYCAKY